MPVQAVYPPTSLPRAVAGGAAVAMWGVALLCGALPALACLPSSRRTLRLGAVGVYLGAAFVGSQSDAQSGPLGGLATSLGYLLTLLLDAMCFARGCTLAPGHMYSRVPVHDDDVGGVELTGEAEAGTEEASRKDQGPTGKPNVATAFGHHRDFSVESVVPALAVCFFAWSRGVDLGSGALQLSEPDLDLAIVSVIGQVSLASGALSVLLQDSGLELSRQASLVAFYSVAGPIGVATGVFGLITSHGQQRLGWLSSTVAGVVLFYTMSRLLPRERLDLVQEIGHKGTDGLSRSQTLRLVWLVAGWAAVVALNWPRLKLFTEE